MMNHHALWHKNSYDKFIDHELPRLLQQRLPLSGYNVIRQDRQCQITIVVAHRGHEAEVSFILPMPDDMGIFYIGGRHLVVVPTADNPDLEQARISCVGEQLLEAIADHLGELPRNLPWDSTLLSTLLPLSELVEEVIQEKSILVEMGNWLCVTGKSRCLRLVGEAVLHPSFNGRVCSVETIEGPDCGRILSIAIGADIVNNRLVASGDIPPATLGVGACMIPFIEHSDPARILMAIQMAQQLLPLKDVEPALIQTGFEPDEPGFWLGCNLLTAFTSLGADTFEDAVVISESAAQKLNYGNAAQSGDKLANRHGTKGVVGKILPDAQMPHLSDGTPVELVYSFLALHTRLNFGQELEAVTSRIAAKRQAPICVAPFGAPSAEVMQGWLQEARLPDDGLEQLYDGQNGRPFAQRTLVGWVYWGVTNHIASEKMTTFCRSQHGQMMGEMEVAALRSIGAYEFLAEQLNLRSTQHPAVLHLTERIAASPLTQAPPPTPLFTNVQKRLRAAGIAMQLNESELQFNFQPPTDDKLKLATPLPHPWIPECQITEVGLLAGIEGSTDLRLANNRLQKMLAEQAPPILVEKAQTDLQASVTTFLANLLPQEALRLRGRSVFSGRTVIAPGSQLDIDQVGLPEEMAWDLLGPLAARHLGGEAGLAEVEARSSKARAVLDEVSTSIWVVINRAPTLSSTAILAFRPVLYPEACIRLHPLSCRLLNADFDGDQVAVYLPVTEAGQKEAEERLTILAHLNRDPKLIAELLPPQEALWGLAWLSLQQSGQERLQEAMRGALLTHVPVDREMLLTALLDIQKVAGNAAALQVSVNLTHLGFEIARSSGATLHPFAKKGLELPRAPQDEDASAWADHVEQVSGILAGVADCQHGLANAVLAARSQARGNMQQLCMLLSGGREVAGLGGQKVMVHHGYVDGLTYNEWAAASADTWRRFQALVQEWRRIPSEVVQKEKVQHFTVLARAMCSSRPGIVFAGAAKRGEVDGLHDIDSRVFVGLSV